MSSKLQKQAQKLLRAIEFEPAPLSLNKGRRILSSFNRGTKKDRLNDGRYEPRIIKPQMKYSEIQQQALEPNEEYDPWLEYRDGQRDIWKNKDKIYKIKFRRYNSFSNNYRKEVYDNLKLLNAKLKRHEYIRQRMKAKEKIRQARKEVRHF